MNKSQHRCWRFSGWSRTYDALLHWEALLVISTSNAEDLRRLLVLCCDDSIDLLPYVALPLITDRVTRDFIAHALIHEDAQLALLLCKVESARAFGSTQVVSRSSLPISYSFWVPLAG